MIVSDPEASSLRHTLSTSMKASLMFLAFVFVIAILAPFIANERPYYCKLDGKTYYPVFSGISESTLSSLHPQRSPVDWRKTDFDRIIYAPVPYSYHSIDSEAGAMLPPFKIVRDPIKFNHWLGTDIAGRDVLAGMIRGCRISLLIGFGSMLLALLIGVPLGSLGAYWGNRNWKISWLLILPVIIMMALIIYTVWLPATLKIKSFMLIAISFFTLASAKIIYKLKTKKIAVPVDRLLMGTITIIDSFPGLFIVMILLVIIPVKGWLIVLLSIALLRWPVMARYMRAEVFKMKESNYIKAAQISNLPHSYILMKHIIPYAIRPVMISFIFGVSSAILAESSLSFLGIGLPADELNWGRLLSQSRNHFDAWWLVFFPGCAIFFTLLSLYTIGNELESRK